MGYAQTARLAIGLESTGNQDYQDLIGEIRVFLGGASVEDLEEPRLKSLVLVLTALGSYRAAWPLWRSARNFLSEQGRPRSEAPVFGLLREQAGGLTGLLPGRAQNLPLPDMGEDLKSPSLYHRFHSHALLLRSDSGGGGAHADPVRMETLGRQVISLQSPGPMGHWINPAGGEWREDQAEWATCLAILALERLDRP